MLVPTRSNNRINVLDDRQCDEVEKVDQTSVATLPKMSDKEARWSESSIITMREEEERLRKYIREKTRKRKAIGARAKRVQLLREFINNMSPVGSDEEDEDEDSMKKAEEDMNKMFSEYSSQRNKHRGTIIQETLVDNYNESISEVTASIYIRDLKQYGNPENRPSYRLIFDVINNEVRRYFQIITPQEADNMKSLCKTDTRVLGEIASILNKIMEKQQVEPKTIQTSTQPQEAATTTCSTPKSPNTQTAIPKVILTPTQISTSAKCPIHGKMEAVIDLANKTTPPKDSPMYDLVSSSEGKAINDRDETYTQTIKKIKLLNPKEIKKKMGRPKKVKQPNQYTKKKDQDSTKQEPRVTSVQTITKSIRIDG
ncbi:PREDICTED: uncharacterized protein LOC108771383 isoform X1 [Cyphomyrmex costatus]|uniref:uncharacterized protein LOC108771383 isoform X1 n=2 Tax=Cyphomyrmex costatus TaxID=456900 RepID=UPI000852261C|nr:PREDICTED: uncharacterized protein LOC108771383 isoform X1 [Cyphomyrmex costatus]